MTKDGNPRAFPSNAIDPYFAGMELVDYFAAHALQAMLSCDVVVGSPGEFAEWSYEYAEAMMAEKEKRSARP